MTIAVSSKGEGLDALTDERFGRAARFVLFDTDTRRTRDVGNEQSLNAAQGAGIQTAQTISRLGAGCVLTGHCGPKAFRTLSAAGITVYTGARGTVREAIAAYEEGRLTECSAADVESHWT